MTFVAYTCERTDRAVIISAPLLKHHLTRKRLIADVDLFSEEKKKLIYVDFWASLTSLLCRSLERLVGLEWRIGQSQGIGYK
jgi:predicted nucleotidyltransferase